MCKKIWNVDCCVWLRLTMSRTQVQLRYNQFKETWENVNDDIRQAGQARQQAMKTLKQWKKYFSIIIESRLEMLLTTLAYRLPHAKHDFRLLGRHESCGSEILCKRNAACTRILTTLNNDDPNLHKKPYHQLNAVSLIHFLRIVKIEEKWSRRGLVDRVLAYLT